MLVASKMAEVLAVQTLLEQKVLASAAAC